MIFGADLYRDDLNKVSFILKSYNDYLDAVDEFPNLKVGTWGGAGETALFGDLGVKAMADYVTDAVDDNGIYNAFKHFGLI